ncbi:MAG TPA: hypothetical protein VGH74_21485, partial [Planctomycetaceae bacterium]
MADRKKPAVAFWTTVVVVLVGYPLSFGPACWISSRINKGKSDLVPVAYRPMTWSMSRSETIANALKGYAQLGSASGWAWVERQDDG